LRNRGTAYNNSYYIDDKDHQSSCGGSTKSTTGKPLLSRLEYHIHEDMKLSGFNPLIKTDVINYWRDHL
jgi:hypothetical protein